MNSDQYMTALVAGLLAAVLMAAAPQAAADTEARRVPLPTVKIEKGEKCVEPTKEMRRNHMNMLFHQRDETMRSGIRTSRHSLKGCIECHADPRTNSVIGKDGFCESCHTYAAVRIDCFECHSASPRQAASGQKSAARRGEAMPEPTRRVAVAAPVGATPVGMCVP